MEHQLLNQFNLALSLIKNVEPFDGTDPNYLPEFLSNIDSLIPTIAEFQESHKKILFNYIRNKCTGQIRQSILREGEVNSWETLKEILRRNYGEKKSSVELMDELKTLKLNGTIENFFYKITKLMTRINNRNLTHEETLYTPEEIKRIGLNAFRNHLPEPTKTMIFARNPSSLQDAFKIILEARHQNYTQFGHNQRVDNQTGIRTNFSDNHHNNRNFNNRNTNYRNGDSNPNINNRNTNYRNGNGNQNFNNRNNNYRNDDSNQNYNYRNNNYRNGDNNQNPNNGNRNNSNNYQNNNSQRTRQSYQSNNRSQNNSQSRQTRQSNLNQEEPMEIGNSGANFQASRSDNCLT